MTEALFILAVALCLAVIAAVDARRFEIDFRWVGALVLAGLSWRILGPGRAIIGGNGWTHVIGGVMGAALVLGPILAAEMLGRRWPVYPGDAALLAGIGVVLGVMGLMQTLALGGILAIGHRMCVQRRRGRDWRRGYMPLAPGICAGALLIFLGLHVGIVHAAETQDRIAATELAPLPAALPPELANRTVVLEIHEPLRFAPLIARIGAITGLTVRIEERPSRSPDSAVDLPEAEARDFVFSGTLATALDRATAAAGYAWEWRDDTIIVYRYWDREGAGEPPSPESAEAPPAASGFLGRLIGGIFGRQPAVPAEVVGESAPPPPEAAPPLEPHPPEETASTEAPSEVPPQSEPPPAAPDVWEARPADHGTLKGLLEAWSGTAGWTLVWQSEQDWTISADAAFAGDFLAAVDALLADAATRRVLSAVAHPANRRLVIRETAQ